MAILWTHTGKKPSCTDLHSVSDMVLRAAHTNSSICENSFTRLHCAYLQIVGKALMMTLEAWLGERFTPQIKEAYSIFYGMVITHMKEGLH